MCYISHMRATACCSAQDKVSPVPKRASPNVPSREIDIHRRSTASTCLSDCSSRILYLPTRLHSEDSGCSAESVRLAARASLSRVFSVTPCVVASSLHAMQCKVPCPAPNEERSGLLRRAAEFRLWGCVGALSLKNADLNLKTLITLSSVSFLRN